MRSLPLLFAVLLAAISRAEIFTSMADMELLLGVEEVVPTVIDKYIDAEKARLERLREFARSYALKNKETALKTAGDGALFMHNPLNAYLTIKRLTHEWQQVETLMRESLADEFLKNITSNRVANLVKFPTQEDINGAAVAILRLQDVYRLEPRDIANGKIKGAKDASSLSAFDCYELGRVAYNQGDYYHTLMWMQEAVNRLEHENPQTIDESEVLEYLAFSLYQQGNIKRALHLTKRLAELAPNHPRAVGNVKWYQDEMDKQGLKYNTAELPPVTNVRNQNSHDNTERDLYEKLCRGEVVMSPKQQAKLFCKYKRDRPFLYLAPIKVEVVLLNPMAVIFRQVISDAEIAIIKSLAHPKLARATVQNSVTGELETAPYRTSKSAWLKERDHPVIPRINGRINHMTNLNMNTAEDVQVANYGIGGHYDVHYDHARKEEVNAFKGLGTGNRIATVLFYMSTPEAGGATVFPSLNTVAFPTKGDALFWYNLHRDGEGDMRTRHAACPVLAGVKWVSNKWIHERGQEFYRPCNTKFGTTWDEAFPGESIPKHRIGDTECMHTPN